MIQLPEHSPRSSEADDAPQDAGLLTQLEAVLFVAIEPLSAKRLADLLGEDLAAITQGIEHLQSRYKGESGVHLVEIAGGYRLMSNPLCADAVSRLSSKKAQDRLSPAALETLAIIAYKQPLGRAEIERIRGVGVGPILRHLLELELIKIAGRDEGLGRALLYATTKSFLERFGLKSPRDLPASLDV